jgi:hypothetical protein
MGSSLIHTSYSFLGWGGGGRLWLVVTYKYFTLKEMFPEKKGVGDSELKPNDGTFPLA